MKKTKRKSGRKVKEAVEEAAAATKEAAGIPNIIIQSPMGGYITPADIARKVPKGTVDVYVRVGIQYEKEFHGRLRSASMKSTI